MLSAAKRVLRRFFPRRKHPLLDDNLYDAPRDRDYVRAYASVVAAERDEFVRARYEEGRRWRSVVRHFVVTERINVLDVGGGNGAIELAFAADPRFRVASIEMLWNDEVVKLASTSGAPIRRVIADASRLPFRTGSFDAVTCLETVEHMRDAAVAGFEVARVTRTGGILLVTTPPRWRYAFASDPHFGIRGLALLPPSLQRAVSTRRGFGDEHHYVGRLYSSVKQIARVFRAFHVTEVLSRSRAPRRWFWDAVVLRKR